MTTTPEQDKAFLQLCLDKRLVDKQLAKEIWQEARHSGTPTDDILVARGLMARHTVQALQRELQQRQEPQTIGGFRIMKALGKGGMATVYLAEQLSLKRQVALKLMAPHIAADPQAAERFLREARAAAAINHPNVISIIDVGHSDGQLFMALELVTGGDADQLAARFGGTLPEARALEVLSDCAKGLQALYEARLVHRDLKPSNIFISSDGSAKLADLGLARNEDGKDRLTVTGSLVGTPAFMSPEQAKGEAIDIRSDIYALGATLFALVTGQQPFVANSAIAVAAKVLTEPTPDPRALVPTLSAATASVVMTAMAKDPAQRYDTPNALRAAVMAAIRPGSHQESLASTAPDHGRAMTAPTPATLANPHRPTARRLRRSSQIPWPWVLVVGLVLVLLLVLLLPRHAGKTNDTTAAIPAHTPAATATPAPATPALPPMSAAPSAPGNPATPAAHPTPTPPPAQASPPVPSTPAPPRASWANEPIVDAYGYAVTIRVGEATQRLRWIPPGHCRIGSPAGTPDAIDIEIEAEVTFTRGIWLADTECTQEFFQAVTGHNPSRMRGPRLPVTDLTIGDAIAFTHLLRSKLSGAPARLPSRAEWERACRAGSSTRFSTGDDPASLAGYANLFDIDRGKATSYAPIAPFSDGYVDLAPVASFKPNSWGFYDLHGNVCEFVLGEYRALRASETDPMIDDSDIKTEFIKGGCFDSRDMHKSRSASLPSLTTISANGDCGFRFLIEGAR
ncbi:MAG TPA: bifunctional serine/threonine-protein kinase/formylglycine-generating enzyme family protein [Planctomycetota bacterium]|jgi:serine/threonine protein kinase|nr:bifunctional serine/threonine-protein kinase/formylglycine-generating enzyme family protein [Planctomycetota bacterium]